jgi:hypothetical protein
MKAFAPAASIFSESLQFFGIIRPRLGAKMLSQINLRRALRPPQSPEVPSMSAPLPINRSSFGDGQLMVEEQAAGEM